jgi:hypothetical protein
MKLKGCPMFQEIPARPEREPMHHQFTTFSILPQFELNEVLSRAAPKIIGKEQFTLQLF